MRLTVSIDERHDVIRVAVHDPLEAVLNAEHVDAGQARADRRRADHAVDSRRRSTRHQDRHFSSLSHCLIRRL